MSPEPARAEARGVPRRESAVLVPVYRVPAGEIRIVLVVRTPGGLHGGQVALPGGKQDPDDTSPRATAIRETREEIGLLPESITILESLPVIETRTTGYRIAPFLARIVRPSAWTLNRREIAEVLEPTVAELMDAGSRGESIETFPTWPEPVRIEFHRIGPHRLWGATYRILRPLLPRLAAGEWTLS
jgi:8-oxo-dGTP pyrophosphatase MutT (NUDIX family)